MCDVGSDNETKSSASTSAGTRFDATKKTILCALRFVVTWFVRIDQQMRQEPVLLLLEEQQ